MHRQLSKHRTVMDLIDSRTKNVGWCLRVHSETKMEMAVGGHDAEPRNTATHYWLCQENGEVLMAVQAEKMSVDLPLAVAQFVYYVTKYEKHQPLDPFGFLANGPEILVVDVRYRPKSKALIVIATELGKTRTRLELIDVFIPPN